MFSMPVSTLLKDTSKAEYLVLLLIGLQQFLLALQIVRFHFPSVKMNRINGGSGDDPPCVGIARSIEVHPWHSPHIVRH